MKTITAYLLLAVPLLSQQINRGTVDNRNAIATYPNKAGTLASIPSTCTQSMTYYATDQTNPIYLCTAANTWTPLSTGGGGGGTSVDRIWTGTANQLQGGWGLSIPSTSGPTLNVNVGTNVNTALLTFAAAAANTVFGLFSIPSTVPASLTAEIKWRGTDTTTSHSVTWNWNYACSSTSFDPSLTSAGTVTTSAVSTSNQMVLSSITVTGPSCSAGDTFFFSVVRRGDTDSVTSGVDVLSVRVHN